MMMFCRTLWATNEFVAKKAQEVWQQGEGVLEVQGWSTGEH